MEVNNKHLIVASCWFFFLSSYYGGSYYSLVLSIALVSCQPFKVYILGMANSFSEIFLHFYLTVSSPLFVSHNNFWQELRIVIKAINK